MKKLFLILVVFVFTALAATAQSVTISGTQELKSGKNAEPVYQCDAVVISKSMEISKVEGDCKGFWIQREDVVIKKYEDANAALGRVLKPGTYYVYPYIPKGKDKARVTITLIPH